MGVYRRMNRRQPSGRSIREFIRWVALNNFFIVRGYDMHALGRRWDEMIPLDVAFEYLISLWTRRGRIMWNYERMKKKGEVYEVEADGKAYVLVDEEGALRECNRLFTERTKKTWEDYCKPYIVKYREEGNRRCYHALSTDLLREDLQRLCAGLIYTSKEAGGWMG